MDAVGALVDAGSGHRVPRPLHLERRDRLRPRAVSVRTGCASAQPEIEFQLRPGDTRRGGPGYIHRVQHAVGEPAVTIHVYSPPLDEVGQYRLDENGVIRREAAPGRVELTP